MALRAVTSCFAVLVAILLCSVRAEAASVTIPTDQLAGPPLMGLGVQWDPYDHFSPSVADWERTFQRLDFMHPGFMRVVEPAWDYFAGYDSGHNPTYRWRSRRVKQLVTILEYAKARGIQVVLGDWLNPLIDGDPRVPADFLAELHDTFGFTNLRYYNIDNEPNEQTGCDFGCWTGLVSKLSATFAARGMNRWLRIVGPDNATSWDDTVQAQTFDRSFGLDGDNPEGGDAWVTQTLDSVPKLIGAYDSHRYATVWGIEHGVYGDQMRTRRDQIDHLDSTRKLYFEGEVGMTARQVNPFLAPDNAMSPLDLRQAIDPSIQPRAGTFIDSQPHIREFRYGVWMGDMIIQALSAGVSGASAWDLDDAMHVGGQYGSQNLKQWGFWNSYGGQDGYPASDLRPRPWYYAWSILSRAFPAGGEPLAVPSTGVAGLRVAAVKVPQGPGYRLSLAVVNDSNASRSVRLRVPAAVGGSALTRYDYFASRRPVDSNRLPVPSPRLLRVRLARGVRLRLPGRGLVVLSTTQPARLREGTRRLVDGLNGWRKVYAHSPRARLARAHRAVFNQDGSRAVSVTKRAQWLIYRANNMTSFELKAFVQAHLGLRAYRSHSRRSWTRVGLVSTNPAPALGGQGWYLSDLLPSGSLPPGTNWLKIELTNRLTQLSEVAIAHP